jgi:hypothetical protein
MKGVSAARRGASSVSGRSEEAMPAKKKPAAKPAKKAPAKKSAKKK